MTKPISDGKLEKKLPEDLSSGAVKAARRLQSLPYGVYTLIFVKRQGEWILTVTEHRPEVLN